MRGTKERGWGGAQEDTMSHSQQILSWLWAKATFGVQH